MNFMIFEILNIIILGIVIIFTFYRVMHSDFVNRKQKCYFWKDVEKMRPYRGLFTPLKVKDGKGRIYNEKARFIELGIFLPVISFLALWPFYVFLPNNFLTLLLIFCFGTCIILNWYQLLIVYLRLRRNKSFKLLDENWPYNLNYTMLPLNFNRFHIINVSFYIFLVFLFNSMLAKSILVILLIIIHINMFMDKFDEFFGWNILKNENTHTYLSITTLLSSSFFSCGWFIMAFYFATI